MPKIIANVKEQLLAEARRQIAERGYAKTTIRSVAGACGLAIGTVYNYFSSKDMLIASFMAQDWKQCLETLGLPLDTAPVDYLRGIYDALIRFADSHRALFADADAAKVFAAVFSERHKMLRAQLAEQIEEICAPPEGIARSFAATFAAEALLTWSMAGTAFEELAPVLMRIIQK